MRKLRLSLFASMVVFVLIACSPHGHEETTIIAPTPLENPTITPAPDTAVPATATPAPVPISAGTISRLSVYMSFGEGETPRSIAFSPDGTTLASAGGNTEDFDIRLWDTGSGQLLHTLQGHTGIVWMVAFSPDGAMLASASNDRTVKVWDWRSGSLIQSLDLPNEVLSVQFSPDSQTLAVGGVDQWPDAAIWTYSVNNWQPVLKLAEFWNIPDIAFSPDGELVAGGGTSRNVRIWRTSDGAERSILYHSGQVKSLDVSPDGLTLAIGLCEASDANSQCTLGATWLWDLHSGVQKDKLSDFPTWVNCVAYTPDGSVLIAGSENGTLRAYSTTDYSTLLVFQSPGGEGIFDISPDGSTLATLGNNGTINLWQVAP